MWSWLDIEYLYVAPVFINPVANYSPVANAKSVYFPRFSFYGVSKIQRVIRCNVKFYFFDNSSL